MIVSFLSDTSFVVRGRIHHVRPARRRGAELG
jgi:hypothetical protein